MIWLWITVYVLVGLLFSGAAIRIIGNELETEYELGCVIWTAFVFWPLLTLYGLVVFIVKKISGWKNGQES